MRRMIYSMLDECFSLLNCGQSEDVQNEQNDIVNGITVSTGNLM